MQTLRTPIEVNFMILSFLKGIFINAGSQSIFGRVSVRIDTVRHVSDQ